MLWEINFLPTASAICGMKTEPGTRILQKPTKNLSDQTDLPCELLTSLLIREI
jgi:hypothetical protein